MSAADFTIGGARADVRRSNVSVSQFIIDNGPVELTGPLVNAMFQTVENMERQCIGDNNACPILIPVIDNLQEVIECLARNRWTGQII